MGMWEHIKLGELPQHNTLGFFCWGRSFKIRIEIKRELFACKATPQGCSIPETKGD